MVRGSEARIRDILDATAAIRADSTGMDDDAFSRSATVVVRLNGSF